VFDEQQRLYEAWRQRQLLVHALVATSTHDQQAAQRAWESLGQDQPPPVPWQSQQDDEDAERWSEPRLEADLLAGVRWPFFRDKRFERAISLSNGHQPGTAEQLPEG
jgi:hypothetical protein